MLERVSCDPCEFAVRFLDGLIYSTLMCVRVFRVCIGLCHTFTLAYICYITLCFFHWMFLIFCSNLFAPILTLQYRNFPVVGLCSSRYTSIRQIESRPNRCPISSINLFTIDITLLAPTYGRIYYPLNRMICGCVRTKMRWRWTSASLWYHNEMRYWRLAISQTRFADKIRLDYVHLIII